jgi:hypothetical protein
LKRRLFRIALTFALLFAIDFLLCGLGFWIAEQPSSSLLAKVYDRFFLPLILVPHEVWTPWLMATMPSVIWTSTVATLIELGLVLGKRRKKHEREAAIGHSGSPTQASRVDRPSPERPKFYKKLDYLIGCINSTIFGWVVCSLVQFTPFMIAALIASSKQRFYSHLDYHSSRIAEVYLWPSNLPAITHLRDEARWIIVPAAFWGAILWACYLFMRIVQTRMRT